MIGQVVYGWWRCWSLLCRPSDPCQSAPWAGAGSCTSWLYWGRLSIEYPGWYTRASLSVLEVKSISWVRSIGMSRYVVWVVLKGLVAEVGWYRSCITYGQLTRVCCDWIGIQEEEHRTAMGQVIGCGACNTFHGHTMIWCHAPNTFGTVNMEHTINSSLSWSKWWVQPT